MKFLRIGICCLIVVSVLAFGAVEVWSESILEAAAALLFLGWALWVFWRPELEIHWHAVYWPLLAFLGIAALQLALGITANSFLTRVALLKITACSLLFFLAGQAFRTRRDLRSVTWFLLLFAFTVALFAIIQELASNGKLYWLRPLTGGGSPFGPYVNRNDFAGLMEMLVPVGISLILFRGVRREQMPFIGILTIVPIAALFLSGSRGGVAGFLFELGLLAVILRYRYASTIPAVALAAVLLTAFGVVGWLGANELYGRFAHYRSGELSLEHRWTMTVDTWRVFLDHPLIGSGLGTLVDVYPRYESYYDGKIVDHAHDDYVEVLAEAGIAGGLCGLAFFGLLVGEARKRLRAEQSSFSFAVHAAGVAACAGMLVHSLVDFNLHIPANGFVFLVLISFVLSPSLPRAQPVESRSNFEHNRISSVDIDSLPGS